MFKKTINSVTVIKCEGRNKMKYKRILLKLSGGALGGENNELFCKEKLQNITNQIKAARAKGIEVAVLVGGGNIFRGRDAEEWKIENVEADNIGMMATIINSLMLRGAISSKTEDDVRVMTSIPVPSVAEPYIRLKAKKHLEKGRIIIFGGGLGQPFVTTDYPAVQRAIEIDADIVLMAKSGTDGVYTADPRKDENAKRYKNLSYEDVINKNLKVADQSAFVLARDYKMPLYIFDFDNQNAISKICDGELVGTYIGDNCTTELY